MEQLRWKNQPRHLQLPRRYHRSSNLQWPQMKNLMAVTLIRTGSKARNGKSFMTITKTLGDIDNSHIGPRMEQRC